jgi:hypothetical protein
MHPHCRGLSHLRADLATSHWKFYSTRMLRDSSLMLNLLQCHMVFFLIERLTQPQVSAKIGMSGRLRRGAMFKSVSREASECRLHAEHCADKARLQSDPQLRQCFLEMQQRWLSLARSYEFAERLEFLSAVEERNKEARLIFKDAD